MQSNRMTAELPVGTLLPSDPWKAADALDEALALAEQEAAARALLEAREAEKLWLPEI